jgi:tetratricopeptide (TPR) repeat protein
MARQLNLTALALLLCLALPSFGAKHENWVEVRSPNFVVVSDAGEKQARKTALQFEQIREVFRTSLAVASNHPSPVITILALKDEQSMKELLPDYWTKGHSHPSGLFIYRMNIYFAAVQLDEQSENAFETFYHEYYHSVTMPYFPNLPVWLAEGLAEFYGHTQIDERSVGMGRPDGILLAELKSQSLIPLNVLFKVDQSSPYYNEANKTSIFYAESWALTHYLMIGDRAAHRPKLLAYLKATDEGKPSDQAAAEAFGDLKKLQSDLTNYISNAAFYYMKVAAVPKVSDADLKARPISEAEADAYRGGFAAIRGRSQEAKDTLAEALNNDQNCALAHEYLGIAEFFDGQHEKAIESLSKAISVDPKNSFTRYLRAELSTIGGGMMAAGTQSEDDLRQAIAISPDFAAPYSLLAVYMAAHDENLPEALNFAQKAVSFEPGNSNYQLALAQVLARMEKYDGAKLAASRAQAWARRPQEQANAQSFLHYLQQMKDLRASAGTPNASGAFPSAGVDSNETIEQDEGTVVAASCEGGLKFDLQVADVVVHLRSAPEHPFAISTMEAIPTEGLRFSPCTSLKGLSVAVQYHPDEKDRNSGEIRSLRILAPSDSSKLPPGTAAVEGKALDVACNANDMKLTLALADGHSLVLHASDYTKIRYLAGTNSSLGDMDPCSEMKGRSVKITYAETQKQSFAGEMQTIVVGK